MTLPHYDMHSALQDLHREQNNGAQSSTFQIRFDNFDDYNDAMVVLLAEHGLRVRVERNVGKNAAIVHVEWKRNE